MFRMRPYAAGRSSLASPMPKGSEDHIHLPTCFGISMRCSGCAGAIAPKQASSLEADAETVHVTRLLARRRSDRQTAIIWRGIERTWDESPPHNRRSDQQSGREFSSADTPARTAHATFQIGRLGPEISFDTRRNLQHLQCPAPFDLTSDTSAVSS